MNSHPSELLTIQIGHLSNRVAAHFWHLQSTELNSIPQGKTKTSSLKPEANIFFEEGKTGCKPRALFLDFMDPTDEVLAAPTPPRIPRNVPWDGKLDTVVRSEGKLAITRNQNHFAWHACLSAGERSLLMQHGLFCSVPCMTRNYSSQSDGRSQLAGFVQGLDLLSPTKSLGEEVKDRFRQLMEECSIPGQVQLVVDAEDGLVGCASRLLDFVSEELPKRPILTFPVYNTRDSSELSLIDQQLAKANQLFLLVLLEPDSDNYFRGSWMPMDLSRVVGADDPCFDASILAAAWSTSLSYLWSSDPNHRFSVDDHLWKSQNPHGKRLLTSRIGVTKDDVYLNWSVLNPYTSTGSTSAVTFWREAVLRGIQADMDTDGLIKRLSADSNTNVDPSTYIEFPRLHSGIQLQLSSLPSPLTVTPDVIHPNTLCRQPRLLRIANVLDVPGAGSSEPESFKHLLHFSKRTTHSLLGLEKDLWKEYLEAAQTRLVDAFSEPECL